MIQDHGIVDDTVVGDALRAWREYRGLSQRDLAEASGVHRAQLGAWEAGRHSPTFESIEKVATFFGVSVLRFLAGPAARDPESTGPERGMVEIPEVASVIDLASEEAVIPTGTRLVPERYNGTVAATVTARVVSTVEPEFRVGDVVAVRAAKRARTGQLVVAVPVDPEAHTLQLIGGILDNAAEVIRPLNRFYPDVPLASVRIIGVVEGLIYRDYGNGVPS